MGYRFSVVAAVAGAFAIGATGAYATDPSSGGAPAPSDSGSGGSHVRDKPNNHHVKLPKVLKQIAQCESGGNPRAVSPSGTYRGKFQFDMATWRSLGGRGDPAKAPEWQQDKRALRLYRMRGTAPWPNCAP